MKTIDIFGVIGDEWDGITDSAIASQLEGHEGDLIVRINSPGGFAYEGVAIYNLLKPFSPRVEVMGLAASAASVIAMAGDEIHMRTGAEMMIHDAWGMALGNAQDFRNYADHLQTLSGSIADIYVARTGDRPAAVAAMAAETWLDANAAMEFGLATHTETVAAEPEPENAKAVLLAMGAKVDAPSDQDQDAADSLKLKAQRYRAKAALSRYRKTLDTPHQRG